ncbi:nicotinamide riboside transporter PnuC [soil metagenome]
MSSIEIGAVFFSLLSVWFAIRRSILNWPFGIVGVALYLVLFYQVRLYADMILQIVFIAQALYGWYNWSKNGSAHDLVQVSILKNNQRLLILLTIAAITLMWATALKKYTEASLPYIDAFASTTSFVATWLMARKKLESWVLWITADIVYIGMFWYKELYLSSGIYSLFLALAVIGLLKWHKNSLHTGSR